MRKAETPVSWVVYKMTIHGKPTEFNAVCEQGEWDAMELARPGYHTLVRDGITNEGEAERFARGTAGDPRRRLSRERAVAEFLGAGPGAAR
jgi:hypothetical protein